MRRHFFSHYRNGLFAVLMGVSGTTEALSLQDVVSHTLSTNPEVQASRQQFYSRAEEIRQAKAGFLPSVDLAIGVGQQTLESPSTAQQDVELTRHEASLTARQNLFDGFATTGEVNRQEARYVSAYHEMQALEENVSLRTTEVYLNLLKSQELLSLMQGTLAEHKSIHEQMVLRSNSGVGSRADLDQITARLALAEANVITAHNNLLDAKTNFFRVSGIEPQVGQLEYPALKTPLPSSYDQAEKEALLVHPTLMSAQADISAAEAQYKTSASNFYPRVELEAYKRWDQDIDGVEGDVEDLVIAVRMSYNLYNGGADSSRRRQTAILMEQAREIRGNTHRQVIESLRLSWSAFQAVDAQMKYIEMQASAAKSTRDAYIKQFNIGRRTLLDLLNTENEVVDAKRSLINAFHDRRFSQYRILNSMGRLVREFQPEK